MHLPDTKIIFVHIPKTGGNWVQNHLIHYSDDEKVRTAGFQDLHNRYDVKGPKTRNKHQTVADAKALLGDDFCAYRFIAVYRDPIDRLLSLYFSPHNWVKPAAEGSGFAVEPENRISFSIDRFRHMVRSSPSSFQMLSYAVGDGSDGRFALPPQLIMIRFDRLRSDLARVAAMIGLEVADVGGSEAVNRSAAPTLKDALREDRHVIAAVEESHHRADRLILSRIVSDPGAGMASIC